MGKIERLQAQIDALQTELAKVASRPVDDFENHAVIMFEKVYDVPNASRGMRGPYTYVALKAGSKWYLSGRNRSYTPLSWEELCDFIGDFDQAEVYYATEWMPV